MTTTCRTAAAFVVALLCASPVLGGCARINEKVSLRVVPLEQPRRSIVQIGEGYVLRGARVADGVLVQVAAAKYCARRLEQRARGYKVITHTAVGPSLTMEWITGTVFTSIASLLWWQSFDVAPAASNDTYQPNQSQNLRVYGSGIGLVGTALLVGAVVQTVGLGRREIDMGEKTLKKDGRPRPCQLAKATNGVLRLTLDDGLQLQAQVKPDGTAHFVLPADIDARIAQAGDRATLEALGDWRSQVRISLKIRVVAP